MLTGWPPATGIAAPPRFFAMGEQPGRAASRKWSVSKLFSPRTARSCNPRCVEPARCLGGPRRPWLCRWLEKGYAGHVLPPGWSFRTGGRGGPDAGASNTTQIPRCYTRATRAVCYPYRTTAHSTHTLQLRSRTLRMLGCVGVAVRVGRGLSRPLVAPHLPRISARATAHRP
eukprot:978668-Prymnesium_polylepis.1